MKKKGDIDQAWTTGEVRALRQHYPLGGVAACQANVPSMRTRSAQSISQAARRHAIRGPHQGHTSLLTEEQTERALHWFDEDGAAIELIARRLKIAAPTVQNALMNALCVKRGFVPAERDENGYLTPPGKERLRALLRRGLKGVEIQVQLGVSARTVSNERARYNRELKTRGLDALPPPGNGAPYSGVRLRQCDIDRVDALIYVGKGTTTIAAETGVSASSVKRRRKIVVAEMKARGACIPGCDIDGNRLLVGFAADRRPKRVERREPIRSAVRPQPTGKVLLAVAKAASPKKRMTFEEQLEAVRNGAALVEVTPLRRPDPTITLGGIATAAL